MVAELSSDQEAKLYLSNKMSHKHHVLVEGESYECSITET